MRSSFNNNKHASKLYNNENDCNPSKYNSGLVTVCENSQHLGTN